LPWASFRQSESLKRGSSPWNAMSGWSAGWTRVVRPDLTGGRPKRTFSSTSRPGKPTSNPKDDRSSIHFLAYEYVEHYVRPTLANAKEVVRILKKDVLSVWHGRDARTIKPREVVDLLDGIVGRGSPVQANRTATYIGQMFKFGIHRTIVDDSPVKLL